MLIRQVNTTEQQSSAATDHIEQEEKENNPVHIRLCGFKDLSSLYRVSLCLEF